MLQMLQRTVAAQQAVQQKGVQFDVEWRSGPGTPLALEVIEENPKWS
jgi:hypothetical protein